jgi:hypothetical protein
MRLSARFVLVPANCPTYSKAACRPPYFDRGYLRARTSIRLVEEYALDNSQQPPGNLLIQKQMKALAK